MKAKPRILCTLYVALKGRFEGKQKRIVDPDQKGLLQKHLFRGLKGADINNIGYLLGILPDAFCICPY